MKIADAHRDANIDVKNANKIELTTGMEASLRQLGEESVTQTVCHYNRCYNVTTSSPPLKHCVGKEHTYEYQFSLNSPSSCWEIQIFRWQKSSEKFLLRVETGEGWEEDTRKVSNRETFSSDVDNSSFKFWKIFFSIISSGKAKQRDFLKEPFMHNCRHGKLMLTSQSSLDFWFCFVCSHVLSLNSPSLNWIPPISGSFGKRGPNANGWKPWCRILLRGSLWQWEEIEHLLDNLGRINHSSPWTVDRHFNRLGVGGNLHWRRWNANRQRETLPCKEINIKYSRLVLLIKSKKRNIIAQQPSLTLSSSYRHTNQ